MGIELPGWLTEPLSWITMEWPQADETKLFEAGQVWINFATSVMPIGESANSAAQQVWSANEGPQVDAFKEWWNNDDGPTQRLNEDAIASMIIGAALIVFAAVTLAMKIAWIVALIVLAAQVAFALAAAFITLGASATSIPAFIALCRQACMRALRRVIDDVIMKSIKELLEKAKKLLEKVATRKGARVMPQQAPTVHLRTWHFGNAGSNGWFTRNFPELRHGVNPRVTTHQSHQVNCQSCVVSTDRSLSGSPTSAVPRTLDANGEPLPEPRFDWPHGVNWALGGSNPMRRARGYDDIAAELEKSGPGARGIVHGMRVDANGNPEAGHVFNAVNRGGYVQFIDGQSGNYAYLEDYADYQLMRTA